MKAALLVLGATQRAVVPCRSVATRPPIVKLSSIKREKNIRFL
jgi:hypothetical protein